MEYGRVLVFSDNERYKVFYSVVVVYEEVMLEVGQYIPFISSMYWVWIVIQSCHSYRLNPYYTDFLPYFKEIYIAYRFLKANVDFLTGIMWHVW